MKSFLIGCLCCCVLPVFMWGAQGDTPTDQINAMWRIAAYTSVATGDFLEEKVLATMNAMPKAYAAQATMQEFETWLRIEVMKNFAARVYPNEVYALLFSKIVGYEYGNTRIAPNYVPPTNVVITGTTLTCDDDPTAAARPVVLYKLVGEIFTEQAAGSLNTGTWTWTGLTAGTYVLAYDDNFASLPTVQFP